MNEREKQLKKLFSARVASYVKHSDKIETFLEVQLGAVKEFIESYFDEKPTIKWTNIVRPVGVPDSVMIHVTITYPVGTIVMSDSGEPITLNEITAQYFKYTMYVGLSMDMMDKSKEEIVAKLNASEEGRHADFKEFVNRTIVGQATPEPEFDLTSLTEEQKKALVSVDKSKDEQNSRH